MHWLTAYKVNSHENERKLLTASVIYLNTARQSWNNSLRQEFFFDSIICA